MLARFEAPLKKKRKLRNLSLHSNLLQGNSSGPETHKPHSWYPSPAEDDAPLSHLSSSPLGESGSQHLRNPPNFHTRSTLLIHNWYASMSYHFKPVRPLEALFLDLMLYQAYHSEPSCYVIFCRESLQSNIFWFIIGVQYISLYNLFTGDSEMN